MQQELPKEVAAVLELQTPSGQWRLCKRLFCALGHTAASIPSKPEGAKDGRWATALAVTFLRRRPDMIDLTYNAYSRAMAWVDESLLAQAHKRLAPGDLYYPVDEEASRQGRWQEQAEKALEECGYAYFLPVTATDGVEGDGDDEPVAGAFSGENIGDETSSSESREPKEDMSHSSNTTTAAPGEKRPRPGQLRPTTSKSESRRVHLRLSRKAKAAAAVERRVVEQQSHGLQLEFKLALRVASTTFREGDRVESRWRRPTRLDKPRLDPDGWHPGLVVQSSKNSGRVDVVFEDGDGERLSGIPAKYVRLAPSSSSLQQFPLTSPGIIGEGKTAAAGRETFDGSARAAHAPTMPIDSLCPASRRELAHIASANSSLRRTWEDPVPIDQELARLKMLGEEKMRGRPEWRCSFPAVDFQATKRLSIGATGTGTGAGRTAAAAAAAARNHRRARLRAHEFPRETIGSRTRGSVAAALPRTGKVQDDREERDCARGKQDCASALVEIDTATIGRKSSAAVPVHGGTTTSLLESQAKLVAAAVAYDRCVAGVRECLIRGAAAFRTACTYSDQQRAFEESTAALGPAQPARAGYTDWRGRAVVGLQNATLDVVEAMDSWTVEWEAAREGDIEAGGFGRKNGGRNGGAVNGEEEVGKDSEVAPATAKAPPFLWEGSPLVSTIVGHSAKLVAGAPELKEWYGPGFPIERNPFFLAYSVDDRPATPRSALVRALVNGEMVTTVSRMLLEEREKEEAALKAVVDKQAAAPSWWPTSTGESGGEAHYERIRRAEKVIAREETKVLEGRRLARKNQEALDAFSRGERRCRQPGLNMERHVDVRREHEL